MAGMKDITKYKTIAEWEKDYPVGHPDRLEDIIVTADRTVELEPITVTGTRLKATKFQKKKARRKKKRLDKKQLRIESNIDRLKNKLETVEQKRDPYYQGGVAKAN